MTAPGERTTLEPSPATASRMTRCMWRQRSRTPRCPATPRLDGRHVLVTGGGRGIGRATTEGLLARGARVTSASRSPHDASLEAAFLPLDLSDLDAVAGALQHLAEAGTTFDHVVANAGLWPQRYARSAQGHEIAFATNVLGHHALLRGLQHLGLLAPESRLVLLTGDIYVMAEACTPGFVWSGRLGGQAAYCRSKLGNLWQVREFARRFPELGVHAVHPGVIASELAGAWTGLVRRAMEAVMLSVEEGAQTTLHCVTQPGLPNGSYHHNVFGRVELAARDPGADARGAAELWETLETLVAPVLERLPAAA